MGSTARNGLSLGGPGCALSLRHLHALERHQQAAQGRDDDPEGDRVADRDRLHPNGRTSIVSEASRAAGSPLPRPPL